LCVKPELPPCVHKNIAHEHILSFLRPLKIIFLYFLKQTRTTQALPSLFAEPPSEKASGTLHLNFGLRSSFSEYVTTQSVPLLIVHSFSRRGFFRSTSNFTELGVPCAGQATDNASEVAATCASV
jgi:hypothetical protein